MGKDAVDMNTLPVKPGYTEVEVQMLKDTRERPESEQEYVKSRVRAWRGVGRTADWKEFPI